MDVIQTLIRGRATDLGGGLTVQRLLPAAALRMVGPFIFADHIGPASFAPGQGVDVRPHPHIGLATVTYLFEGEFMHRDSLGSVQRIRPGDVNWMTAGRGIVHSERTPAELRERGSRLHGMQTWVALPDAHEDAPPAFAHHPADSLPQIDEAGVSIRVIAGSAFGAVSPVAVPSPTWYCAVQMQAGARLVLPPEHEERAVMVIDGEVELATQPVAAGMLAALTPQTHAPLHAITPARVMLLGGAPVGPRFIWWNFVATSRERIEAGKADWATYAEAARRTRFGSVPGETEFIPLPAK